MITRNEKLLELLEAAKKVAVEQQTETKSQNTDVMHIGLAIDAVKMRLRYLKSAKPAKAEEKAKSGADQTTGDAAKAGKKAGDKKADGKKEKTVDEKKTGKSDAAEKTADQHERDGLKQMLREDYGQQELTVDQIAGFKANAQALLAEKPGDLLAQVTVEVCDELIAAKQAPPQP